MINLDIDVIIELYWGTNPAWDGYELAKFFNCGYQSIYNFMEKYGIPRRNHSETELNYFKGIGVIKHLILFCPDCEILLIFSKWIEPYKYLFRCFNCIKPYHLIMKNRVIKPEDIEKVKRYKEIANGMKEAYGEK